jgi:predicted kinase
MVYLACMDEKSVPLLIVFLGFPGSGKTYFATRLAEKLQAVTLNSDAMRVSMFGSLETIERIRQTQRARLYDDVFGAMDYAAVQTLRAGHSVIYDAQQTKRRDRKNIEKLAASAGAIPVLVWIKTNPEVALRRGQEREARADSHQYDAAKMKMLVERFEKVTDLPEPDENVMEISGELPFEEQYAVFGSYISAYMFR